MFNLKKKPLEVVFKTLDLIWKSSPKINGLKIFLVIFNGLLPLGSLYTIKLIVDELAISINANSLQNKETLFIIISIWIGIGFLGSIVDILMKLINETHQEKLTNYIQAIIHKKSSELDYSFYESPEYQDTFHRAQKDGINRPSKMTNAISEILKNSAVFLGLIFLLSSLHWSIVLILIITQLPVGLVQYKYSNRKFEWENRRTVLNRKSNYLNNILTNIQFAKEMRVFNFSNHFRSLYNSFREKLFNEKRKINTIEAKMKLMAATAELIGISIVFYFIIHQSIAGILSIGALVMYVQGYQRGQSAAKGIFKGLVDIYENKLFLVNFFRFIDLDSNIEKSNGFLTFPQEESLVLKINDVSFAYPHREENVLRNINLEFNSGKIIAIVGENGSGKSTLVKILTRIYNPDSGFISINGKDIKDFELLEFRKNVSVLFQDYSKYFLSLKQNIAGYDDVDDDQLEMSLRQAEIEELVKLLPNKSNSILGRQFENGIELSGGQWQRIAHARTFYQKSRILIFDEPTSHIDGNNEALFLKNLINLKKDRIIIIISHKQSNLDIADEVILLKEGTVLGHDTLNNLQNDNAYFRSIFRPTSKSHTI
jgi:ATP-binding cassette, subfamily B, bacterial